MFPPICGERRPLFYGKYLLSLVLLNAMWDVVKIEVLLHMISSNKHRLRRGTRLLLEGKIVSRDGTTVIDVKIRDMSATGAILRMPPNVNLPESFSLLVVSDGKRYPIEKRKRKGERLVVQFVGEPRLTASRKGNTAI
jgi:hypothetical protein